MPNIGRRIAERHEALVVRLEALAQQVDATAARRPELAVGPDLGIAAEGLLHECRTFSRGLGALPPAAPSYGGLAAQLADARARLEAFELRHTSWDDRFKCVVWRLPGRQALPVQRFHPRLPAGVIEQVETPEQREIRDKLAARINALTKGDARTYRRGYNRGYDDAVARRPRSLPDGEA